MSDTIVLTEVTSATLQAALDDPLISRIEIAAGTHLLTKAQRWGCILLRGDHARELILHPGAVLKLTPDTYTGDSHLFYSDNAGVANVTVRGGVLDGSWSDGAGGNEQMHGIQGVNASFMRIEGVTFRNFKGDGIKLFGNLDQNKSRYWWIEDCVTAENGRSGFTIQRCTEWIFITNCLHRNNKDQSIDFEPTGLGELWRRPQKIFITGGGIEHNSSAHALTLSNSMDVTIRDYFVDGSVQAVNPINLTMENVRVRSNLPIEGKTPRKGLQLLRNGRNILLSNVWLEQRDEEIAASFEYNNGGFIDGLRWIGGGINQPFVRTGINLATVENATIEGLSLYGPNGMSAIAVQPQLADVKRTAVRVCQFGKWETAVRVSTGERTLGRMDVVGNTKDSDVATMLYVTPVSNITKLVNEFND